MVNTSRGVVFSFCIFFFYSILFSQTESKNSVKEEICRCFSDYKGSAVDSLAFSQAITDCLFPVLMRDLDAVQREMGVVGDPNAAARLIANSLLQELRDSCLPLKQKMEQLGIVGDMSWVFEVRNSEENSSLVECVGIIEEVNTGFPLYFKVRASDGRLHTVYWITEALVSPVYIKDPKKLVSKEVNLTCKPQRIFFPEKKDYFERCVLEELVVH